MRLLEHPDGRYRYLEGIEPYSSGVIATPGHELVQATFRRALPYREAFAAIRDHLEGAAEPMRALAAVALRSPEARSFAGFGEFNSGYAETLAEHDLLLDAGNPIARTNVVPVGQDCRETCVYAFAYATAVERAPTTFVVAGAAELADDALAAEAVVRPGDTSPDGLRAKARQVLGTMSQRLAGLGVSWQAVTAIDVYSRHGLGPVATALREGAGPAAWHGYRWFEATPPVTGLDFEMDVRGVRREEIV